MKVLTIKVRGKVQGVFFRASTKEKALELGIKGLVRNLPDGDVFIKAYGEEKNLRKLLSWCKKGPEFSRVDNVTFEWSEEEHDYSSFEITY